MSSSSTTACSRSPSPSTPEGSDNLDPAITQEVVNAWCHSLTQDGYLISDDHFPSADKEGRAPPLDIGDLIQEDAYDDIPSNHETHQSFVHPPTQSLAFPMATEPLALKALKPLSATKLVPPPPSQSRREPPPASLQSVVYPAKDSCSNLPIMFPSIPEGGTKSRVETQIRVTVDLAHASSSSGEPLKYDRVGSYKWLRLPKGTSTKRRTRKEGRIDAAPEDSLYMVTEITCASPPNTKVTCCSSCQGREAKRVERKLAARVRPARPEEEDTEEAPIIPGRGKHEDPSKLIQFNCPEVLDFSSGTVVLPLRITCYCRHHREKTGFNVHFTMFDSVGRIVGSGTTRPIMITDDHKSTGVNKSAAGSADASPPNGWSVRSSVERTDTLPTSALKRRTRDDSLRERTPKKRPTKPYDGRRSGLLSRKTSNGSLNSGATSAVATRPSTPALSPDGSSPGPFSKNEPGSPEFIDPFSNESSSSLLQSTLGSPVVSSQGHVFDDILMPPTNDFNADDVSMDIAAESNFLSPDMSTAIASSMQSPVPMAMPAPQSLDLTQFLFNSDPPPPMQPMPAPKIHRLIPATGPTYGGIEITILGANFHHNLQLNCVFGEARATSTQRWSDNTLVCMLPPSPTPGVVAVWFEGVQRDEDGSRPTLFAYTDESDRALMELALQVVGLKMTGKIEDARDVAMRIVNTTGSDNMNNAVNPNGAMQMSSAHCFSADLLSLLRSRSVDTSDFEKLILDFLAVLDAPLTVPTRTTESTISHPTSSGQTMLHLATFLGFTRLVSFLIDHGIDVDARDNNGFTALHFAALKNSASCARLLVEAGAALDIVNALGKTPAEIAPVGLFEDLFFDDPSADDESEGTCSSEDQEEAAWGDAEALSDEGYMRVIRRRRSDRKLAAVRDRPMAKSSPLHKPSIDEKAPSRTAVVKDVKEKEAGIVDEKQMAASIMEMVQRTFAQLQDPQGMKGMMQNIPLHLPGMPAWGTLPQMPAVFPVYVPIPAMLWGDRRGDQSQSDEAGDKIGRQPWLGMPTTQEWKAMWEKWMLAMRSNEEAPPAYTPRDTEEVEKPKTPVEGPSHSSAVASSSTAARRVGYEAVPVPEREVKSYGYRPLKKQTRRAHRKHDRMLFLFWIPILLFGLVWIVMHSMQVGFTAVKTVLTFKAGLVRG